MAKKFALAECFPNQQKCGLSQCLSSRGAFFKHGNSRNNTVKHPCVWATEENKSHTEFLLIRSIRGQKMLLWLNAECFPNHQKCGLSQCPSSGGAFPNREIHVTIPLNTCVLGNKSTCRIRVVRVHSWPKKICLAECFSRVDGFRLESHFD